jgi:hypothetical protein
MSESEKRPTDQAAAAAAAANLLEASRLHLEANRLHLEAARKHLEANRLHLEANRLHLEAVVRHRGRKRPRDLPVKESESNSITEFLRSGKLEFSKDLYMPFEQFSSAYESFVNSMGLVRLKLIGDRIAHPLLEAGCIVQKHVTLKYPRDSNSIVTGRFIVGTDFAFATETPSSQHKVSSKTQGQRQG